MSAIVKVPFHGDELLAQQDERGVWVVVKRVCESIGLTEQRQMEKLKGKPWATTTMMVVVAEDGKTREMMALHLDSLPMWLATIDAGRVAPAVRAKIERYQVECARVLRDHFFGKPESAPSPAPTEMPPWFAGLLDRVAALETRLLPAVNDALGGQIGSANAAHICLMLRTYAALMSPTRDRDTVASWRTTGEDELRSQLNWQRSRGAAWSRLPMNLYGRALAKLEEMLSRARKTNVARVTATQLPLRSH